jgi:hypothetical protein
LTTLLIALALWDYMVSTVFPVLFAAAACFGIGGAIHLLSKE